jgi:hypothetical protein
MRRIACYCLFLQFRRRRFFICDPLRRPTGYKNGARTTDCLGVVFGCGLEVMFCRHLPAVANPLADHVARKLFFQLRLSRGPQVLPQLGPRVQSGTFDDLEQLCAKVLSRIAITGDEMGCARFCLVPHFL